MALRDSIKAVSGLTFSLSVITRVYFCYSAMLQDRTVDCVVMCSKRALYTIVLHCASSLKQEISYTLCYKSFVQDFFHWSNISETNKCIIRVIHTGT